MLKKIIIRGLIIGIIIGIIIFLIIFLSYTLNGDSFSISFKKTGIFLQGFLAFLSIGLITGLGYSAYIINRLFMVSGTRMLKLQSDKDDKFYSEESEQEEKKILEKIEKDRKNSSRMIIFYSGLISSYSLLFIITVIVLNLNI